MTLWTADETATYLRVHRSTVYQMAREGLIPSVRLGKRVLFRAESVEARSAITAAVRGEC